MRRAWKLAIAVAVCGQVMLGASRRALAFHEGSLFGQPAGAGGAGGIFYTGVPSERGWTCAACHTDAPGLIGLELDSSPRTLLDGLAYQPGASYTITAQMTGEHAGLDATQSNFNSLALTVIDGDGAPAGSIYGYAPEDFYASGPATIVSSGTVAGLTTWSFIWRAPPASTGPASIHVAVVDGNGAGSGPDETLTDPWGDDVFVGTIRLGVAPSSARNETVRPGFEVARGRHDRNGPRNPTRPVAAAPAPVQPRIRRGRPEGTP